VARAKLSGSLLARKDAAATSDDSQRPTAIGNDMPSVAASVPLEGQRAKPIALTVKVDQARYEALKVLGARTRRSNQEILLAALDAYLRRTGEGKGP
jgi:hypothetical protein